MFSLKIHEIMRYHILILLVFSLSANSQIESINATKVTEGERVYEYERIQGKDSTTFGKTKL